MNPSTDLVTAAFAWLHAGSPDLQPARGTGIRLTAPEAAALWMGIVKAVERLPHQPKAWAYYAYVDGKPKGDSEWEARTVCLNVREALHWTDPKAWESDPAKREQKKAVIGRIVAAVPKREPVINEELARVAGTDSGKFVASRIWGRYREAVNAVLSDWDEQILIAITDVMQRRRVA